MSKERMSLEEIQQTREYRRLTAKQQLYVSTYIATGLLGHYDDDAAVRAAYNCKDDQSFHTLKYTMRSNPRILDVLHMHFGKDATEVFLEDINRAIRNKKLSIAQVQAMHLKAQVMGIGSSLGNSAARARHPKPRRAKKTAKKPAPRVAVPEPPKEERPPLVPKNDW